MTEAEFDTEMQPAEDRQQALDQRFCIDFASYDHRNRSRDLFLRERMCAESRGRLGEQIQSREPLEGPPGGGVRFATRRARYGEDPVALISECCASKPEFRDPRLPLKEILFRLLLANGNQPMSVRELRAAASEWAGFEYGGSISNEGVMRLLETDEYYGFRRADD